MNIVNNPMPTGPIWSQSLGNNPNVDYPLANGHSNFNDSAQANAPSTSRTFLNNSITRNAPNTSNNGNAPNNNGNTPLPPLWTYVVLQKNRDILKKQKNLKTN